MRNLQPWDALYNYTEGKVALEPGRKRPRSRACSDCRGRRCFQNGMAAAEEKGSPVFSCAEIRLSLDRAQGLDLTDEVDARSRVASPSSPTQGKPVLGECS